MGDCDRFECAFSLTPNAHNGAMDQDLVHKSFTEAIGDATSHISALRSFQVRSNCNRNESTDIIISFHTFSAASRRFMLRSCNGLDLRDHIPPLPPNVGLANFDPSLLLDHHLLDERNLETLSISTCKLHGSPKMGSASISPHHHLLHHHHHHHPHHRVQNIDLMDDIPLPFHTDNYTTSPISGALPSLIDHPPLPPPPPYVVELLL